jgi:hypothetical protein
LLNKPVKVKAIWDTGATGSVFICRTLFAQPFLESSFRDPSVIRACYPIKDFHTMYVAAVEKVLLR